MSKYILNTMVVLLTLMLYRRSAVSFIKGKWAADKKAAAVSVSVGTVLLCGAVIYFLTFFEACFVSVVASVGFLMRYTLLEIFKAQYARKHGKLHVVKAVCIICFSFWLGLALFYKTDIGVKTGLKNYFYHKYHEEFKYIGVKPDGVNYGFYPINGERDTDTFNVVRKRWLSIGSRLFASDNYYGIIIRDEYEKRISEYINKYFNDYKVYVKFNSSGLSNLTYMSDEFDKNTSLNEFIEFQHDIERSKSCNYASVEIFFNKQPLMEEKDIILNKINLLNDELIKEYSYINIMFTVFDEKSRYSFESLSRRNYIKWSNPNNWDYKVHRIDVLINSKSEISYFGVDDKFFKENV